MTTVRYRLGLKQVLGASPLPGCSEDHGANNPLQSAHPGGAYVAMADGSVLALSEKVDLAVLLRLAIRDDGQQVGDVPTASLASVSLSESPDGATGASRPPAKPPLNPTARGAAPAATARLAYKSPQEVGDVFIAATAQKDWRTGFRCFAPKSATWRSSTSSPRPVSPLRCRARRNIRSP